MQRWRGQWYPEGWGVYRSAGAGLQRLAPP